ncbi:MAG: ribonuclease 3 [Chloroflexota bacterium]|nr:MAG: ribonuclease 3 [Chloroflexota bacterium]
MASAAAFAARLGLPVGNLDLLEQALVHASYLHEHPGAAPGHNERLEFLGDAVVNLVVSEAVYARHPTDDEGLLSARRAAIVSTGGLARLAGRIGLGDELRLGEGEAQRGGRRRPSLLASAFEALAGALYLDLGFGPTRDWLLTLLEPDLAAVDLPGSVLKSPKSRLQEYTQRRSGARPVYRVVEATGPDHEKLFRVVVEVDGQAVGFGTGRSRRDAETEAAEAALETLRRRSADPIAGPTVPEAAPETAAPGTAGPGTVAPAAAAPEGDETTSTDTGGR